MRRTVRAVYENGVLRPLERLDLPEHQEVRITLAPPAAESPDEALRAWREVLAGLSPEDIAAIEAVALDRTRFLRPAE